MFGPRPAPPSALPADLRTLRVRRKARDDVAAIATDYLLGGGVALSDRFAAALEHTLRKIQTFPNAGSPFYGEEIGDSTLRARRTGRFPHVVFYRSTDTTVTVIRVLPERSGIIAVLRNQDMP